jgi:hypothetical protein
MKTVSVFIPLAMQDLANWKGGYGKPWTLDVFDFIATLLVSKFTHSDYQVGTTDHEALQIINLHSQQKLPIIVHVKVCSSDLHEEKKSEIDLYNLKHRFYGAIKFHCLKRNTQFVGADIISFRPMVPREIDLRQTMRCNSDEYLSKWPNLVFSNIFSTVWCADDKSGKVERSSFLPPLPSFESIDPSETTSHDEPTTSPVALIEKLGLVYDEEGIEPSISTTISDTPIF